ncbi:DUF4214 domain-containing protein [Pengzhenrongella phosphoraccumulans]|uniref:DUF4214 domain-containing protein n=1 Tax=Pengzhenrongella phosphoraccumulans TaxID=3114394 RepID=UPI00388D676D
MALAAGPATAGAGIDGVTVPLDAPTSHSQDIRWGGSGNPAAAALPAGAPSLRYAFPARVTSTDVNPASLHLEAWSAAGVSMCPSTTAGLHMDGWDLIVDPAAILASTLATCASEDWFSIRLLGSGNFDTLDLSVELYLAPGSAPGEVRVDLFDAVPTIDFHSYTTTPARAAPGMVLDLVAEPDFFYYDYDSLHVLVVDSAGRFLSELPRANRVVSNDSTRLTITLPADMPATAAGLQITLQGFMNGKKAVTVPFTTPIADPVGAYVTSVYEDLFSRQPDAVGLSTWSSALRNGGAYGTVADAITYSDENRIRMIAAAYRTYLDRAPDAIGGRNWLDAMRASLHIENMQAGFISSPEYYNLSGSTDRGWITHLYKKVLNREPANSEVDSWQRRLNAGTSRTEVALGFLYSTEHLTTVVDGYYINLLHRHIDPTGTLTWIRLIQAGSRDEQIIAGIVSSQEYRANVPRS